MTNITMKKFLASICFVLAFGSLSEAQTLFQDDASKLYGYKNSDGSWLIAPQYQYAYPFEKGRKIFAVVRLDQRYGCIDNRGEMIVRPIFLTKEEALECGRQWQTGDEPGLWLYPVKNPTDRKWGFVNYYGDWKFEPQFEDAGTFVGVEPKSFAPVKQNNRWGCIDRRGTMVIAPVFMEKEHASEAGMQWIHGLHYETWTYPTQNERGRWGYVDYLGRWVVPAQYQDCGHFGEDRMFPYAQVKRSGRWGNIDRHGNEVSFCIFFNKADAAYALKQKVDGRDIKGWRLPVTEPASGLWGWVDYSGEWAIQPKYQEVCNFPNDTGDFAAAKYNDFWGVVDYEGTTITKHVFTLASEATRAGQEWDTHQELGHWQYPIKNPQTGYWGYVNFKGEWSIIPHFQDARTFIETWNNRVAPAKKEGKWGGIDHTGQFVIQNIYETSADAYKACREWASKSKFNAYKETTVRQSY